LAWKIEFSETAKRTLKKLDKQTAQRILNYLDSRVAPSQDPRSVGQALKGPLRAYWRYRVGDYRLICEIRDSTLVVLVLEIGNRREVYR
jgi:mRNA interferase RelE/StbE